MQHTKNIVPSSPAKKTWTPPRIESIELNAAKNGTAQHGDGPLSGKS